MKKRQQDVPDYRSIINAKGKYKYDFKSLEYKLQKSYEEFLKDFTDPKLFQQIFEDLYVIAYGILETTEIWVKADFNSRDVAHEYATGLIERILEGRWRAKLNPGEDKFGWVPYIRLNIRDTIYGKFGKPSTERYISMDELREHLKDDLDYGDELGKLEHPALVDHESFHLTEIEANNNHLAKRCSNYLKMMFGDEKYYLLVSKTLTLKVDTVEELKDPELILFTKTALVLFKRLYESYNLSKVNHTRIDKVFNSSLYLASILSSEKDKRLYVSLDLANLYRLALAFGGEEIQVPTIEELDELVSTARVSYEILSANLDDISKIKKIRDKVRDEFNVFVRFDKLNQNVRNVFRYISTEIADPAAEDNTLVNSLLTLSSRSDQIVNKILDRLESCIDGVECPDELIKVYKEMIENLSISLNMMTNIKSLVESRFTKGC